MVKEFAPIIIFAYNRLLHIQKTVSSLLKNREAKNSDLYIFSDGSKNDNDINEVNEVRKYIYKINGFKKVSIRERNQNFGLGKNITSGVTEIIEKNSWCIVLEDDLETSPYFLRFMNEGLDRFSDEERVVSIHGYIYPVKDPLPETFFLKGADCLGWGTWRRGWEYFNSDGKYLLTELKRQNLTKEFDFNGGYPYTRMLEDQVAGKNDSWAVRWYASTFLKEKLSLYPGHSLVRHIGNDGSGTNFGHSSDLDVNLSDNPINITNVKIEHSMGAYKAFQNYFLKISNESPKKVKNNLKRLVKIIINIFKMLYKK